MGKKTKVINIHGVIGSSWWDEGVSLKNFLRQFQAAEKDDDVDLIILDINSPGRSTFEGISIFNHIQSSDKEVQTRISGIAYSMGAIIAMAGDKISMFENATMLLHNASGFAFGNANDLQQRIEMMNKVDNGLIKSVSTRTGLTEDEVRNKWFDYKDHTLDAKDALEDNLIDEIITGKKSKTANALKNKSMEEVMAYFTSGEFQSKSFLENLSNKFEETLTNLGIKNSQPPKPEPENSDSNSNSDMKLLSKFKSLLNFFNVKIEDGADHVDVEPTEDQLQSLEDKLVENNTLNEQKTKVQASIKAALEASGIQGELEDTEAIEALSNKVQEYGKLSGKFPLQNNEDPPLPTEDQEDPELKSFHEQVDALMEEVHGPENNSK